MTAASEIITLKYPVNVDGLTISTVTMRRARGKDLRKIETAKDGSPGFAEAIMIVSCLCDLPEATVDEFDAEDIAALAERSVDFLPDAAAKTGGQ